MLGLEELTALFAQPESERLEWKASASDEETFGKALCALANDLGGSEQPGYLLYGKSDNGAPSAADTGDQIQQRVASWARSGKLLPPPVITLQRFEHRGNFYLLVHVQPSPVPPVYFDNQVYVRVGPTTRRATPQDEHRLIERRRALALTADQFPVQQAGLEDLDIEFFERSYLRQAVDVEVLRENQRSQSHQLKALQILNSDGDPTYAGVLLLGYDPRRFIPGAYVQFLRLDGTTLTDTILSEKILSGPLHEQLRQVDDMLDINITTAVSIDQSGKHAESPDFPKAALKHLIINALLHRTYERSHAPVRIYWFTDRVEIHSPGGPYGSVTKENFGTGIIDYRNPVIAKMLKDLGYVQRFGYGIQSARRELEANGNPPLMFQIEDTSILVTVRPR